MLAAPPLGWLLAGAVLAGCWTPMEGRGGEEVRGRERGRGKGRQVAPLSRWLSKESLKVCLALAPLLTAASHPLPWPREPSVYGPDSWRVAQAQRQGGACRNTQGLKTVAGEHL